MPSSPRPQSLTRATLAVAAKELRSGLRDRQTAIYTLVLPICMYPVLFWIMIQGALVVQGRREQTRVQVELSAVRAELVPDGLVEGLRRPPPGPEVAEGAVRPEIELVDVAELPPIGDRAAAREHFVASLQSREQDAPRPDALLHLAPPGELSAAEREAGAEPKPATLFFDSTESGSSIARGRVRARVQAEATRLRADAARAAERDPLALEPFDIETRNVADKSDMGAFLLSFVLPMLLVIMTVMGAFFPAVDLTAGERERKTSETTLLLPVPRLAVHQGKILAVCVSALVATTLNLFALGLSAEHLLGMLGAGLDLSVELPIAALLSIAPLALLFAFSVSALLTGVAALAHSFKEGQALLGPVQLVFIFPAMAGALPGLELTPGMAFVPVVNVVLAFRVMLRGEFLPLEFVLTAVALLVYAVLAIALAVRVLSRETLQLSDKTISLRKLLPLLRSSANSS